MSNEPRSPSPMDCREVERSLEPWLDGEFDRREQAEVGRHLAACGSCRDLAEERGRERTLLRAKLREAMGPGTDAGTAPEQFRRRIAAALVRERQPLWRRAAAPLPLAALAACAAGVLVVLLTHGRTDSLVEEAVVKHARDLPLEVTAASVAPDLIPGLLARDLAFNPRPPPFKAEGLRLVGARRAHLSDRPAAYMLYQLPRGQVGLFIVVDPDLRLGETGRPVQLGPATVRMLNARGYNVAVWRHNEMVYSVVSDLDERDLASLVETAAAGGR